MKQEGDAVMSTDARRYAAGNLRVSDADRDQALAELSAHFEAGRLTSAEFDERSGRALSARTGSDLATLVADLPVLPVASAGQSARPGAEVAAPGDASPARGGWPTLPGWLIVVCVIAAASALTSAAHRHGVFIAWWLIPLVYFVFRGCGRRPRRGSRDS
jgi:uncharacterized protein DUF1707